VVEAAGEIAALLPELAEKGNPNLLSDVGVAAILAQAAFEAGRLNVEVNLAGCRDERFKQEAHARVTRAAEPMADAEQVAAQILASIAS